MRIQNKKHEIYKVNGERILEFEERGLERVRGAEKAIIRMAFFCSR